MPIEAKAYKCGYCSRCFTRINNAISHENACENNPKRRHCRTCIHGVLEVIDYTMGFDGHRDVEMLGPFCAHFEKPIHEKPYFIECAMYQQEYGPEAPVPWTCEYYEYKGKSGWTKPEVEE